MAKKKPKPTGDPGTWIDNTKAMALTGLTRSGVEYQTKIKRVRRKKIDGKYHFSTADCKAYRRGPTGPKKGGKTKKAEAADQPAYMNAFTNGRMKPKAAQTAVQKARWVFEGLDMGTVSPTDAIKLIRNVMYEGSN